MKRLIFILGGVRNGKSSYAVKLAKSLGRNTAFIATATSPDEEMKERIKRHKLFRPRQWKVIEEGRNIGPILSKLKTKYKVILVDCLGLLISNLLADNLEDQGIEKRIKKLVNAILKTNSTVILVSNEVGMGVVPDSPLARRFMDLLGQANQMLAEIADEVIFMQAGIPLTIKGERKKCRN